jgi:hypothetical protein
MLAVAPEDDELLDAPEEEELLELEEEPPDDEELLEDDEELEEELLELPLELPDDKEVELTPPELLAEPPPQPISANRIRMEAAIAPAKWVCELLKLALMCISKVPEATGETRGSYFVRAAGRSRGLLPQGFA